jgi:hypothetical protein
MKLAVVGAGVSGLVAAYRLGSAHEVTLFESEARLGGHANTVTVQENGQKVALDTGFLVFNTATYPNFVALHAELGVPSAPSRMSFSVRSDSRDFEYAGTDLGTLYAQRRHLASPSFHRMVWDILRFYREAPELLAEESEVPLRAWLEGRRYSRQFIEDHLLPMLRAVWSAGHEVAEEFPARFLVRFFKNHGFLSVSQPPWLTIPGGSRTYVDAIARRFRGEIRRGERARALKETILDEVERTLGERPDGFAADGATLRAVLAEITNTPWGERHAYVVAADGSQARAAFPKAFHVSPFQGPVQRYVWHLPAPAALLSVEMLSEEHGSEVFRARLALERRPLTRRALFGVAFVRSFMSLRTLLWIYGHAFLLWRKGAPVFTHPKPEPTLGSQGATP